MAQFRVDAKVEGPRDGSVLRHAAPGAATGQMMNGVTHRAARGTIRSIFG